MSKAVRPRGIETIAFSVLLFLSGLWWLASSQPDSMSLASSSSAASSSATSDTLSDQDFYRSRVQPIFDSRCVVCHSCNNAPCQLNLTSYEGAIRGASKSIAIQPERLSAIAPMRLGIDGHSETDWRKQGFFSVLEGSNPYNSILRRMLTLKDKAPTGSLDPVPTDQSHQCPSKVEFQDYVAQRPHAGMPYNLPKLTAQETNTITQWIRQGLRPPRERHPIARSEVQALTAWQKFLNEPDQRHRLLARYLYEHLFLAHVHFQQTPQAYYRLIRNRINCDQGIDEISTRRPNDDPQGPVFYCFKYLDQTIVNKTHLPYLLDIPKLQWVRNNFFSLPWKVLRFPSYDPVESANPFKTFESIPVEARYRFLLQDSRFHIATFIKGPVCNGSSAVSSIDEQFYVFFIEPKSDLMVRDAEFRSKSSDLLVLPAEKGSDPSLLTAAYYLRRYPKLRNAYRNLRQESLRANFPNGLGLENLWDGNKTNPNAVVTVFRHDDHSFVVQGARGDASPTAMVLDYGLFERLVYNLVVGFDLYGNLSHQLHTRVYMGMIRMEGENNFLDFFPSSLRQSIRENWYTSQILGKLEKLLIKSNEPDTHPSRISIASNGPDEAKNEMFSRFLFERLQGISSRDPDLANWKNLNRSMLQGSLAMDSTRQNLSQLVSRSPSDGATWVSHFPDSALIAITNPHSQTVESLWTIIRNKRVSDVGSLLFEESLRTPERDTLLMVEGVATSYPNYFFIVPSNDLEAFVRSVQRAGASDFAKIRQRWGRDRTHSRFWQDSDRIHRFIFKRDANEAGFLDYTRYDKW